MQLLRCSVLTVGVALAAVAPVHADDAKAARAIIDKAIKAHGGGENLKKFQGSVSTFKGTFRGMGMELPMTGEISVSGKTRLKLDLTLDAGGQKIKIVNVVDGDKGWTKVGDAVMDLGTDAMTEAKEQLHAGWVASLAPLVEDKGYSYTLVGDQEVGEKKVTVVRVSAKDRRDVTLYFDKATGLVVKHDAKVKDEATGQEVTEETVNSEFKDVQGTKAATKFVVTRDGKPFMDGEITDVQLSEKLDDGVFVKP
jgi:hypothetical protein